MLQNCTIWRVAARFFLEPTRRHYLLELSRELNLAHTSVTLHLRELLDEGIIIEERERRGTRSFPYYRANVEEEAYRHHKRLYNLDSLRAVTKRLADTMQPDTIILFGSYERGEDTEESDIDLYLHCRPAAVDLDQDERELRRRIQLHFSVPFEGLPVTLQESIRAGITLRGALPCSSPSDRIREKRQRCGTPPPDDSSGSQRRRKRSTRTKR